MPYTRDTLTLLTPETYLTLLGLSLFTSFDVVFSGHLNKSAYTIFEGYSGLFMSIYYNMTSTYMKHHHNIKTLSETKSVEYDFKNKNTLFFKNSPV